MGYMHIDNLYKYQEVLLFKRVYVLEKIHGTSANVSYKEGTVRFFSGGAKHDQFITIFNHQKIEEGFKKLEYEDVTVYGEAYGGSMQKMSDVYGDKLRFIAFDVKVGENWLNVPDAEQVAKILGLEFVWYTEADCNLGELDKYRDQHSIQAIRNGLGEGKIGEGIIIRPLIELTNKKGKRIIAKHKRDDFRETKSPRPVVDPNKLQVLLDAEKIADEWVTDMRLNHVLDKIEQPHVIEKTPFVIKAMFMDIAREGEGEIVITDAARASIGRRTASMFKAYLYKQLEQS